ncbi:translation initiation factor eIF3 subunit domain-containing protein [Sarocladium implicatum]|nr:translation initiation factor eIF3 subunit domain-containing protein [Sarocladium implicatum]
MPAPKQWDDEESSSSSAPSAPNSPPVTAVQRRRVFEDEEDDSDVLDSWDAAEDSEVEREKAKKAAEAKAKADAEALANKKSKAQRIAEHQAERARLRSEGAEFSEDEETPAERRERLRRTEKDADLAHAQDLFGDIGVSNGRKATTVGAAVVVDPNDPNNTVNIADLPLFNPTTKTQFTNLRETLAPIITGSSKKAHYSLFLQEFSKQLAKELPSDQIKKIASSLTALGNEKMKEEKAALSGNKKTKAAKTKVSAVVNRSNTTDMDTYDDTFGDDDFM